jgi:hypothetical protein
MLKSLEMSPISLAFKTMELTLRNGYAYARRHVRKHEDAALRTPNIGHAIQNEIYNNKHKFSMVLFKQFLIRQQGFFFPIRI